MVFSSNWRAKKKLPSPGGRGLGRGKRVQTSKIKRLPPLIWGTSLGRGEGAPTAPPSALLVAVMSFAYVSQKT